MRKIMFNDKYGLTEAVLSGRKTMTRRIAPALNHPLVSDISEWGNDDNGKAEISVTYTTGLVQYVYPQYQPGEVVAVAQSYKTLIEQGYLCRESDGRVSEEFVTSGGFNNKMFAKASLMPHHIRITNIKVERLCDISDEDCRKEGVVPATWRQFHQQDIHDLSPQKYTDHDVWTLEKFRKCLEEPWTEPEPVSYIAETPKAAFAYLIDRISGKGAWERNPWVFAYEFEKI